MSAPASGRVPKPARWRVRATLLDPPTACHSAAARSPARPPAPNLRSRLDGCICVPPTAAPAGTPHPTLPTNQPTLAPRLPPRTHTQRCLVRARDARARQVRAHSLRALDAHARRCMAPSTAHPTPPIPPPTPTPLARPPAVPPTRPPQICASASMGVYVSHRGPCWHASAPAPPPAPPPPATPLAHTQLCFVRARGARARQVRALDAHARRCMIPPTAYPTPPTPPHSPVG